MKIKSAPLESMPASMFGWVVAFHFGTAAPATGKCSCLYAHVYICIYMYLILYYEAQKFPTGKYASFYVWLGSCLSLRYSSTNYWGYVNAVRLTCTVFLGASCYWLLMLYYSRKELHGSLSIHSRSQKVRI